MKDRIRVIDVETSGLDPVKHEILDISILGMDGRSLYTSKIRPVRIETAEPMALRINGYSETKWKTAPTFEEVAEKVLEALEGGILLGHNVAFDRRFVEEAFRRVGRKPPKMPYRVIDTSTLIYEHLEWESFSLGSVATFLGVDDGALHTAYADAQMTRKIALKLMRSSFLQRAWWRFRARGTAGPGF